MSDVKAFYGAKRDNTVLDIASKKHDIKLSALLSWPIHASYDEDVKIRSANGVRSIENSDQSCGT